MGALKAADFVFRAAMGLIVIGWIAFMISVQAEYRSVQKTVKQEPKSKPTQTFKHEPVYERPSYYTSDQYSRPMDDTRGDNPNPSSYDWGN